MTRETRGSTRCDPLWCAALGGALALMATPVGAQQPSEPTDGRPPATFEWRPSAALTNAGYDSNVFNQPVNAKGDFFAVVSAGLMPAWRLGDAKLEGGAHLTYNYFHEYDSERALDGAFDGRAELPVGATRVHVDGKYLNARQRVNFEIDQRARRSESNFGGGIDVPVGDRITAIFKVQRSGYAFADEPGINADLSHTLNRVENGGSATLNYAVTPLTAIELNGTYGNHRFEFAPERDGSRARGDVSLVLDSDALIGGRASVGWEDFKVNDPAIESFAGLVAAANLSTTIGAGTHLGGGASRDVQFSSDEAAAYYVQNRLQGSLVQELGERWDVGVRAEKVRLDYADAASRTADRPPEHISTVTATMGFHFSNGLRVGIDVEGTRRNVTGDPFRYYRTRRIFTSISKPIGF